MYTHSMAELYIVSSKGRNFETSYLQTGVLLNPEEVQFPQCRIVYLPVTSQRIQLVLASSPFFPIQKKKKKKGFPCCKSFRIQKPFSMCSPFQPQDSRFLMNQQDFTSLKFTIISLYNMKNTERNMSLILDLQQINTSPRKETRLPLVIE